ncbi:MAG: lactonase family protein [Oscillospiraceae bacterium]|nr:lactonase family protein [Oscillospiraceae bacterium]
MAKYKIFIGTYSKGPGNGLLYGEFNENGGKLRINDALDIENPAYMQISPQNQDVLYGVSETASFNSEKGGALFSADISDPLKIRLIDIKCTHGRSPCHLCVWDDFVFTANYSDGSLSIMETDKRGNIDPAFRALVHFGKGPNLERQEASHIHFASMAPGLGYLAVCDLGLDKVFLYPYVYRRNTDSGLSTAPKIALCPPGSGPRHLAFSKGGKYMYVLTELSNMVLSYHFEDGIISDPLRETPCLPPHRAHNSHAAAIHVSPDGKLLLASNRGADCITVFAIRERGNLELLGYIENQKEPRDFNFSPDGNWLVSAHQKGDKLEIFKKESGSEDVVYFIKTGEISAPAPVCVLFGGEI